MTDPVRAPAEYDFSHKYRGRALIIVNKHFCHDKNDPNPDTRAGAAFDRKKMKDMFKALDFKVSVAKDLTANEMKNKIEQASQDDEKNMKCDCFALVISSHGEEVEEKKVAHLPKGAMVWRHRVLGSDYKPIYIDDIIENFRDDKAQGLAGKPKLFFIQACRSRHNHQLKTFDIGLAIKVAIDTSKKDVQPSDAGDHGDGTVFDHVDEMRDIEDINSSWIDNDENEWNSDTESDAEDNEDNDLDSDDDFTDAKGAPASGTMPASPQPELTETKKSESAELHDDECDAGQSQDTGNLPPSPFDIVPINCPNDCLLVYPAMSGAVAFRNSKVGSRLLHCLHKEDNLRMLVGGCDLLQYLTRVSGDMGKLEFSPELGTGYTKKEIQFLKANMPFKVTANITHRLQAKVKFKPKSEKSIMALILKLFK